MEDIRTTENMPLSILLSVNTVSVGLSVCLRIMLELWKLDP